MACNDPYSVFLAVAYPGDIVTVWVEKCSSKYYQSGSRTVIHAQGNHTVPVYESQLNHAAPLTYVYQSGEVFSVNLYFDPSTSTMGKSCEVHASVDSPDGTVRASWCTKIVSGTVDSDLASFNVKGA